jgi:ribonucleoside-diphosphate reductase alpha chain
MPVEEVSSPAPKAVNRRINKISATRYVKPTKSETKKSLRIERVFSDAKVKPFDQVEWEKRTAEITDDGGKVIFKQENVEVPKSWSGARHEGGGLEIFLRRAEHSERETSVRQLIHRITRTIADWGIADGYFSKADGEIFYDELTWLCLNQYGAFNSPVWFNVGLVFTNTASAKIPARATGSSTPRPSTVERAATQYEYPQGSACFIQSVQDNMESIMHLAYSEAMLFKYGSGTGTDLTPIRSSREKLSGGGRPSGPMSFPESLRPGGQCREVRRQNPPRGEDEHAPRLARRHRGVH